VTDQDFTQFSGELAKTADAFNHELTPSRIDTYFDDLSDLSLEAVLGALRYSRKALTFFPKIAELRRYAEGSVDDRAELAWRTVVDLVKFEGGYPSLQVYDGGIGYAIECFGGWGVICAKFNESSPEMVANYEKHFKSSYKLGAIRDEGPRYFAGSIEGGNRSLGAWKSPTVNQPVCLVRPGKVVKVVMPFDVAEGRLTSEAVAALASGGNELRPYLPLPAASQKALTLPADAEMVTAEEVAELRASIRALTRPSQPSNVVSIANRKVVTE
jgi:hypothetical protein